jgi:hypothetical protein
MAGQSKQAALTALLEYLRIKYPNRSERIAALKSDYLAAFERKGKSIGKELGSSSVDGVSTTWVVSLSTEEQLEVMALAIQRLENRSASTLKLFARD